MVTIIKVPEEWKGFSSPILAMPPEIQLKIFALLHPIDKVCLSLVNKYIYYKIAPRFKFPMDIGAPGSDDPAPLPEEYGCHHCVPVLYYPAHCELNYHLRSFVPKHLKYCAGICQKYTAHETSLFSNAHEHCGVCSCSYRRRYERGRRMLDMLRPGEKQLRLRKWYNS